MSSRLERVAHLTPTQRDHLARLLRQRSGGVPAPAAIPRRGTSEPARLAVGQERLWVLWKLRPEAVAYNVCRAFAVSGDLAPATLRSSLAMLRRRHAVLRTRFPELDGGPRQVVEPGEGAWWSQVDLAGLPRGRRGPERWRVARVQARQPFDLERGPVFRARLVREEGGRHLLVLIFHHAVIDGWSLRLLLDQLSEAYAALRAGGSPPPGPGGPSFADYAEWQQRRLADGEWEAQAAAWRRELQGAPMELALPADRPRPETPGERGGLVTLRLAPRLAEGLARRAREARTSRITVLTAAVELLLGRYTGQDDFVVGQAYANRESPAAQGLVGFLANTLPLRADLAGDPTVEALVARVAEASRLLQARQEVPLDLLLDAMPGARDARRPGLFQVVLAFGSGPPPRLRLAGARTGTVDLAELNTGGAHFDLTFAEQEEDGQLHLLLEHDRDLFDPTTARRLLRHLKRLLEGFREGWHRRVGELTLLTPAERQQVSREWNDTASAYARESSLGERFERVCGERGSAVALEWEGGRLSYGELAARSAAVARSLLVAGLSPGDAVAVVGERSPELVVALLGVVRAGGCYVPLDPSYPERRLGWMLADSGARLVLADGASRRRLGAVLGEAVLGEAVLGKAAPGEALPAAGAGVRVLELNPSSSAVGSSSSVPLPVVAAEQAAYVMYTSGSTGRPKGVTVSHRNVLRLVLGSDFVAWGPERVFLLLAPVSFDASTLELWGALLHGARLALAPPGPLSLDALGRAVSRHRVTTLWLTAGLFHQVVEEAPSATGRGRGAAGGGRRRCRRLRCGGCWRRCRGARWSTATVRRRTRRSPPPMGCGGRRRWARRCRSGGRWPTARCTSWTRRCGRCRWGWRGSSAPAATV